jgi:methylmalonyl-CoA/ethylmalonyl-CoA epimerase
MSMIALDHVAVAVHRITDALPLFRDLLGGQPGEAGEGAEFTYQQFTFPGGTVELLEPRGEDSFLVRFLKSRGPGLHHVTFKVQDLPRWAARLRAAGYRVVGERYDTPEWRELFIHPKSGHGVLIQLAETLALTKERVRGAAQTVRRSRSTRRPR